MTYIIIINCKDPHNAKPFTMITSDENMVYSNIEEANRVASTIERTDGEGSVRVVAI